MWTEGSPAGFAARIPRAGADPPACENLLTLRRPYQGLPGYHRCGPKPVGCAGHCSLSSISSVLTQHSCCLADRQCHFAAVSGSLPPYPLRKTIELIGLPQCLRLGCPMLK
jgi:hypothetical protein